MLQISKSGDESIQVKLSNQINAVILIDYTNITRSKLTCQKLQHDLN